MATNPAQVENVDQLREDMRDLVLTRLRPYPGLSINPDTPDTLTKTLIDTSGIDTFLVVVRILMAYLAEFDNAKLTEQSKAVLVAARSNLGWTPALDRKVKFDLLKTLYPDFATAIDKESFQCPSFAELYQHSQLVTMFHTPQFAISIGILAAGDRFKPHLAKYSIAYQLDSTNLGLEEYLNDQFMKKFGKTPIGGHSDFLRVGIFETPPKYDINKIRQLTITSAFLKNNSPVELEELSLNYLLFMVIRRSNSAGLKDRVRLYNSSGGETFYCSERTIGQPSVREPEKWDIADGGNFILFYRRCGSGGNVIPVPA